MQPWSTAQLRADLRIDGRHDENQLENFLTHLGEGATAELFRCTVCGTHLACTDASQGSSAQASLRYGAGCVLGMNDAEVASL